MRTLAIATVLAALAGPALAQTSLPQRSRAESQINDINRSLQSQQQQLRQSNQSQFETNQLRNEVQRSQQFPSTSPGTRLGCPPGSIGC